jgi:hypothetical protein
LYLATSINRFEEINHMKKNYYTLFLLLYGVQLAPNPFGNGTAVQFSLENSAEVELAVLNTLGQTVRVVKAGNLASGTHRIDWDGNAANGKQLGAGVYFFRLKVGDRVVTRKGLRMQ